MPAEPPTPDRSRDDEIGPMRSAVGGQARFDSALQRLGDEVRGEAAAASRSRQHWLRQQAAEESTFAGVLVDLAERGDRVALATEGGRRHRGWLRAVAADFCVLASESGEQVVIAFAAIASVRPEPGRRLAGGDRAVVPGRSLADHLGSLGDHRPRVVVATTADDEIVVGVLRSVGRDVLVVALDGADRGLAYVPVASVAEVSLPVSG